MPSKPPSIAATRATRGSGRPSRDRDVLRPNSNARGYGRQWRAVRLAKLARSPLCERCTAAGRTQLATLVDHITPVRGDDGPLFWDDDNHQSLCVPCHAIKTRADMAAGLTRGERLKG